jgi:hypothetical protein
MREDILQALSELIKEKTELKAEKIELGLMDDLKKRKKFNSEGFDLKDQFLKSFNDASVTLKALESNKKDLDITLKFIDKIKKQFKELGVDIPKEVIDIQSEAEQIKKDTNRYTKFKF